MLFRKQNRFIVKMRHQKIGRARGSTIRGEPLRSVSENGQKHLKFVSNYHRPDRKPHRGEGQASCCPGRGGGTEVKVERSQ